MNKNDLKFAFWGTPDVAAETLEILKTSGYLPSLVVTSPDKPQGRKMTLTPPPVKVWAMENKIPYLQPEKLNLTTKFDLSIVVAYGKIIPEEILNLPRLGSVNVHYSLLPKYRGASPVETAILNGDKETGVSIQKMEYKMDTGPLLAQETIKIIPDETAPDLRKRLTKIGADMLVKILPDLAEGKIIPAPQEESQATYCKKIKKEDGLIDISDLVTEPPSTHLSLYNKFRAYAGWPRIYFLVRPKQNGEGGFQNEKRIIITDALLKNGKFEIKRVIPEGKKETSYGEFLKSNT